MGSNLFYCNYVVVNNTAQSGVLVTANIAGIYGMGNITFTNNAVMSYNGTVHNPVFWDISDATSSPAVYDTSNQICYPDNSTCGPRTQCIPSTSPSPSPQSLSASPSPASATPSHLPSPSPPPPMVFAVLVDIHTGIANCTAGNYTPGVVQNNALNICKFLSQAIAVFNSDAWCMLNLILFTHFYIDNNPFVVYVSSTPAVIDTVLYPKAYGTNTNSSLFITSADQSNPSNITCPNVSQCIFMNLDETNFVVFKMSYIRFYLVQEGMTVFVSKFLIQYLRSICFS